MVDEHETRQIFRRCDRQLRGHYPERPHAILRTLCQSVGEEEFADVYGEGPLIEDFEKQIATLLGKPAAVFIPSGTMAQLIAMRVWCDTKGVHRIAFHSTSHLELHERKAYQELHSLNATILSTPDRCVSLDDVQRIKEPLGALLLELPQREIGGVLPSWEELCEMSKIIRERGIPLHMDGARLWECKPYYKREYSEISALFDSVYVSFYKGLGGIAGAVLAGPEEFIAQARIWQRRHGGNLVSLYPYVVSARDALNQRLPRMGLYYEKALEIARALHDFPEVHMTPNPPQAGMMHVYLMRPKDSLNRAALEIARDRKVAIARQFVSTQIPGQSMFELGVGDATLDFQASEIRDLIRELLDRSRDTGSTHA